MILLRQKEFSNIQPSPKYLKKEKELGKKGYAVLPKVKGRKKDFVYFSNGKEIVGYNLFTGEEHKLKNKSFSEVDDSKSKVAKALDRAKGNVKFKAKRAKLRYKDTLDYFNNEEAVSGNRKALESWVENSKKRSGSNDSRQTIYHKNGMGPETIKDPEKYEFRKEETRRQEEGGQRAAEKALRKFDKERKHPKLAALKAAVKSVKESAYSEKSPKLSRAFEKKFSEEKNDKAAKVGKEIGMAGGALGVGALGGIGVHKLAKNSGNLVKKSHSYLSTSIRNRAIKIADKTGKQGAEWFDEYRKIASPKLEKLRGITGKVKPIADKVSKFAKTKGGKWAIIGGTTAALGGTAYLGAKKKDKKK